MNTDEDHEYEEVNIDDEISIDDMSNKKYGIKISPQWVTLLLNGETSTIRLHYIDHLTICKKSYMSCYQMKIYIDSRSTPIIIEGPFTVLNYFSQKIIDAQGGSRSCV